MTRETDYFKSFCKISKAFGTTARRDDLLKLIVESAVETMDGKAACLFLTDKRQDVFMPVAQTGLYTFLITVILTCAIAVFITFLST